MLNLRKQSTRRIRFAEPLEERQLLAVDPFQSGFNIQIIPGPNLLDPGQPHFPQALFAIDRAVNLWESVIRDPITVTIAIEIADIVPFAQLTNVLATGSYDTIRNAIVADGIAEGDDDVVQYLPTSQQFTANLPPDFSLTNQIVGTKANFKALGIPGLDATLGAEDASLVLDCLKTNPTDTCVPWDFDERDGLTGPSFTAIVAHNIGHALGFESSVDTIAGLLLTLQQGPISPAPLDLFRFENTAVGFDPATPSDFTNFPRQLIPGSDHIFDDLDNEWELGSGTFGGQAENWRSNSSTSVTPIGIMDFPGSTGSAIDTFSRADWRALDLIGWDVAAQPVSDLVGNFFQVDGTSLLQAGETINLDFSIRNADLGIAGPFDVGFYIVDDTTNFDGQNFFSNVLNGTADQIGQFTFEGLLPQDITPVFSTSVVLPLFSPVYVAGPGQYRIAMVIDPKGDLFEDNEFNNAGVGELFDFETVFFSPIPLPPDVAGSTFNIVEDELTSGEEVTVTFDISNLGQGAASPFQVDIMLSQDSTIGPGDFILGTEFFTGLDRSTDSTLITRTFTLPDVNHPIWSLFGSGNYFIGAFSDAANVLVESKEANNSSLGLGIDFDVVGVTVSETNPPPGPDPDMRGIAFGVINDPVTAGDMAVVDFIVENNGSLDAGQFRVDFFLSSNSTISTSDFFLGQRTISGLGSGLATVLLTENLQLPDSSDAIWNGTGTYFIGMIIDRDDVIAESNESNNSNRGILLDKDDVTINVPTLPADLQGANFNVVQEPLEAGDSFDLQFTVENTDAGNAGPFSVKFFLSSNSFITSSDEMIGQFSFTGLAGNSSQANTVNLTLPSESIFYGNADDTYFIGMIVDADGVVVETNENNNRNRGELIDFDSVIITVPGLVNQGQPGFGPTIGAFNPGTDTFFLRNSNDAGDADIAPFNLLGNNAIPISGDWNGNGVDTVGVYNPGTAEFRLINANTDTVAVDTIFNFGLPGWIPLAGDWNGDGTDTIGVYNPATATFFLKNTNSSGVADIPAFNYGLPGWTPIVGDWNGNGTDTVGVYNQATATFFLRNTNDSGVADVPAFNYGIPNWVPLAGDWNNNGTDTVGVYNADTATSFLRNANDSGVADVPAFNFGQAGWVPLAGKWTNTVQPLVASGGPSAGSTAAPSLTSAAIQTALSEAVGKWAAAGLDTDGLERLSSVDIRIADLPGATLGLVVGDRVYLDSDAAGYGWFLDATPGSDEEYELIASQGLLANSGPAADGVDLLTVMEHELGHMLGLDDSTGDPAAIMFERLAAGQRRTPSAAEVDEILSGDDW